MSGLEIAGLVLGALPVIVGTLKTYRSALSSYKDAIHLIDTLHNELTTEYYIFIKICETLLQGIAPRSSIDMMLNHPDGPEWQQYEFDKKLRLRLGDTYTAVKNSMEDLKGLMEDLMKRLAVVRHSKSKLTTRDKILQEIRKRTAFTLKKRDYDHILLRIISTNKRLCTLIDLNKRLELPRQYRSQWRFTQLMRDLSLTLFNALNSAATSCCLSPHDACPSLGPRPLELEHGTGEEQAAKELDFQVTLGLYSGTATTACPTQEPLCWYDLSISVVNFGNRYVHDCPPTSLQLQLLRQKPTSQQVDLPTIGTLFGELDNNRSRSSSLNGISQQAPGTQSNLGELIKGSLELIVNPGSKLAKSSATPSPDLVLGLCKMLRMQEKRSEVALERTFYGLIWDQGYPERRFGLYTSTPKLTEGQQQSRAPFLSWQPTYLPATITLREVLRQASNACYPQSAYEHSDIPIFLEFQDKLELSVLVAINILHLYNTPWLPSIITLDDIEFRLENEAHKSSSPTSVQPNFPYRPFVNKSMPYSAPPAILETIEARPGSRRRETTVFSFGLILIQIMLGRIEDKLEIRRHCPNASTVSIVAQGGRPHDTPAATQTTTTSSGATTITPILSMDDYMDLFKLGSSLNDEDVLWATDDECHSAVEWCLKSIRSIDGLREERFCQEFYVNVISPLQEALDKSVNLRGR